MKLTVPAAELAAAVGWVLPAVPRKPAMPILNGVLLTATCADQPGEPDMLTVTANGYDNQLRAVVSGALVGEPGSVVVPARLLHAVVSSLSGDLSMVAVADAAGVELKAGRSRYRLDTLNTEHYPSADFDFTTVTELDADALRAAVGKLGHAAASASSSVADAVPCMRGVRFRPSPEGDVFMLETTDRYRLALTRLDVVSGRLFTAVPDVRVLADVLKGMSGRLRLNPDGGELVVADDSHTAKLRCYDHKPWKDTSSVIVEPVWVAWFAADELAAALSRLAAAVDDVAAYVDISVTPGEPHAEFSGNSSSSYTGGVETLPVDLHLTDAFGRDFPDWSGPIDIRFNISFLLEAIKAHGSPTVGIGNHAPGVPKPAQLRGDESLVTVLMPVRKS